MRCTNAPATPKCPGAGQPNKEVHHAEGNDPFDQQAAPEVALDRSCRPDAMAWSSYAGKCAWLRALTDHRMRVATLRALGSLVPA